MGLKPVTKVNRTKCLAEAVKRHFGFTVEFLNGANKCLDVRTSNLALSYCYKAAQHFITAPTCIDPKVAAGHSRKM